MEEEDKHLSLTIKKGKDCKVFALFDFFQKIIVEGCMKRTFSILQEKMLF